MKENVRVFLLSFALCLTAMSFYLLTSAGAEDFRARASSKPTELKEDDVAAEIQFGREVAAHILGKYKLYENDEVTRYVNLVGKAVAANAGRPELEFRFGVLKTDSVNAYAAPGGYVLVTRGALLQMEDESELAAVLAHEIAHVNGKHIVRELNIHGGDDSPVGGLARFMGGAGDPAKMSFLNLVDKAVSILFERGYKIEDEKEADTNAVFFLAFSDYDPAALTRYFEKIKPLKEEELKILSKTHPPFDERISLMNKTISSEGMDGGKYYSGKERFDDEIKGKI